MARNDNCSYSEQWRNGWLTNPRKCGKKYFADLKMRVKDKKSGPQDYDYSSPAKHGKGFIIVKTVEIPESHYLELVS